MKVKAKVSFSGIVTMAQGEEKELEGFILSDLLRAGYVVPVNPPREEKKTKRKSSK